MDQVDWLLVGTGDVARKRVAAALSSADGSRLVGVCDVVPERARELAEEYGVGETYSRLDEALAETRANAVYIATPISLHVKQAIAALDAGKHVLVEKPLGLTAEECGRALAKAEETPLTAGCAYFRRFYPRYMMAQEMLASGQFGRVVLVRMAYFSWFNPAEDDPKHWRVVRAKSGGGPLADMGAHMFDVLIGLFGMPKTVFAKVDNLVHKWDVEDSAVILMTLESGAQVTASFNWNSKTWSHEFEIVGTEAKVKWHPYDGPTVLKTVGRDIQEIEMPNAENVHLPLVQDFVQAVLENRSPAVPWEEAAKTNILLDAVYESAGAGRELAL